MKILLFTICCGFFSCSAAWAATDPAHPRVTVIFDHPDKFTDIRDSANATERGKQAILEQFREFLVRDADRLLPAGDHLTITFTDIKLAGDYLPWLGPNWQDVRIIKDIYAPRLNFSYVVTDASGKVLRQKQVVLDDIDFMNRITLDHQDQLRYEKDLLNDWLHGLVRDLK